jgi:hypothetical protein
LTDGVLPLNDLKFRGSLLNNQSVLQWSIGNEANVARYELEFADQPSHFKTAGKLEAQPINNSINNYQFIDKINTGAATRFYRLKIVQRGGSYTYSGIIFLSLKDMAMQVYPNPFRKELNVQFRLKTTDVVKFRLLDFYGREVFVTTENLSAGYHSVSLAIPPGYAPGMYVLEVLAGKGQLFQQEMLKR